MSFVQVSSETSESKVLSPVVVVVESSPLSDIMTMVNTQHYRYIMGQRIMNTIFAVGKNRVKLFGGAVRDYELHAHNRRNLAKRTDDDVKITDEELNQACVTPNDHDFLLFPSSSSSAAAAADGSTKKVQLSDAKSLVEEIKSGLELEYGRSNLRLFERLNSDYGLYVWHIAITSPAWSITHLPRCCIDLVWREKDSKDLFDVSYDMIQSNDFVLDLDVNGLTMDQYGSISLMRDVNVENHSIKSYALAYANEVYNILENIRVKECRILMPESLQTEKFWINRVLPRLKLGWKVHYGPYITYMYDTSTKCVLKQYRCGDHKVVTSRSEFDQWWNNKCVRLDHSDSDSD